MRTFRAIAGTVAAAAVLLVATASPALAHDELIASDPTAGQQLDSAPTEVSLTFSADVLAIGAAVIVVDDAGTDWTDGEPAIEGGAVTTPLRSGLPAAGYEVRWRVVSSDGHPISGTIPFSVAGATDPTTPEQTAAGDPTADRTAPDEAGADETGADAAGSGEAATNSASEETGGDQEGGPWRLMLVGLGGAAVALAVFFLVRFLRARSGEPRS